MPVSREEGRADGITTLHRTQACGRASVPNLQRTISGGCDDLVIRRNAERSDILSVTWQLERMRLGRFGSGSVRKFGLAGERGRRDGICFERIVNLGKKELGLVIARPNRHECTTYWDSALCANLVGTKRERLDFGIGSDNAPCLYPLLPLHSIAIGIDLCFFLLRSRFVCLLSAPLPVTFVPSRSLRRDFLFRAQTQDCRGAIRGLEQDQRLGRVECNL